ncbi:MAG TPA: zinc-dependent alcohol dehydrogenase family protein [Candidatus Lokiarchaeia archaeon]|nr:zinc-dependent alcohol dehydrogenase family protein [Candidatus Lokiarchaeia archaeon]
MRGAKFFDKHDVRVDDYPEPVCGPGDTIVSVKASGVCGTDVHVYEGEVPLAKMPVIPGHEFAGEVLEVGENVTNCQVGDRVAIEPNLYCGQCHFCRTARKHFCENWMAVGLSIDGGFAERARVPSQAIYPMPANLSYEQAAFFEPTACVLHGIERANLQSGETAMVFGAGSIGLLYIQLLKRRGAGQVILAEIDPAKKEFAQQFGPDLILDPRDDDFKDVVKQATRGYGPDVVFDAAGSIQVLTTALEIVQTGGRIIVFGVPPEQAEWPLHPFDIYRREISVIGSFTNPYTNEAALKLLSSLQTDSIVSAHIAVDDIEEYIHRLQSGEERKVQINY